MSLLQRLAAVVGLPRFLRLVSLYPPYLGAGVRVTKVDEALRFVEVEMPLTAWNRNYVGTHFGGSLYAMCDPFFMILAMAALGPDYVVWDKSASIDFLKPGRGRVRARFELTEVQLAEIRASLERQRSAYPRFEVMVVDDEGTAIARIGKVLSVRPKRR